MMKSGKPQEIRSFAEYKQTYFPNEVKEKKQEEAYFIFDTKRLSADLRAAVKVKK